MPTSSATSQAGHVRLPPLANGDHLTAEEFLRRYEAMPHLKKAELIEGVVYVSSPVSEDHGSPHVDWNGWLAMYRWNTPGVKAADNTTVRLGERNVAQPDVYLRILPTHGGQTRLNEDGYVFGAPELVVEVAASSASFDLHTKLEVYQRFGVREYVVSCVWDGTVSWFINRGGEFQSLPLGPDGIYRSEVFPGLWLDPAAMMADEGMRVVHVL
jgi:Uma2 family endonuclease